jgi:hypothetical protein
VNGNADAGANVTDDGEGENVIESGASVTGAFVVGVFVTGNVALGEDVDKNVVTVKLTNSVDSVRVCHPSSLM